MTTHHDPGDEDRSVDFYCENCGDSFDRDAEDTLAVVRQASIERGKECDALRAEVERLTGYMNTAGLQCFTRGGTPEQVAAHMRSVVESWLANETKLTTERDHWQAQTMKWREESGKYFAERDALRAEVARLTDRTRGHEWQEDVSAVVVTLRREVDHWRDARNSAMAAGEILKAEADKLRAEVERMRPIVEVAARVRGLRLSVDSRLKRDERSMFDDLSEAVDSYRSKP